MSKSSTGRKMVGNELPVIVLGAGGHARVVVDTLSLCNRQLIGVVEPRSELAKEFNQMEHIQRDDDVYGRFPPDSCVLANGIGMVPGRTIALRKNLYERFISKGYRFLNAIHPGAIVSDNTKISDGAQIMAGAVVQSGSRIGRNTIINTSASIDHDCRIGDHTHIAPGAILCGDVRVGNSAFVGAGAVLLPSCRVSDGEVIPAGAVLRPHSEN